MTVFSEACHYHKEFYIWCTKAMDLILNEVYGLKFLSVLGYFILKKVVFKTVNINNGWAVYLKH